MKPRAVYQFGIWKVWGKGSSACALDLPEAYRRWEASVIWRELIQMGIVTASMQRLMNAARALP